jgi:hypothetical protein
VNIQKPTKLGLALEGPKEEPTACSWIKWMAGWIPGLKNSELVFTVGKIRGTQNSSSKLLLQRMNSHKWMSFLFAGTGSQKIFDHKVAISFVC